MPRIVISAMLVLLPLMYFYPAVLGRVTLAPGDGWAASIGLRVLLGRMIAQGHLPLWDPYIFGGMPFLASIYPGALYPPDWLFALLQPDVAMNVVMITTYHVALIGTYLYTRSIGVDRVGSLIAGTAFAFSGFLVAHLGHTSLIAASAWLPWIVLALERVYRHLSWRWVTLGAIFIALQLFAGVPQATLYVVMLFGAYWLFCVTVRVTREQRWKFILLTAAMAFCGILLSLIQLLPLRELLPLSGRSGIDYETFSTYSLPPAQVLGLIFPYFFGGGAGKPYTVNYWGVHGFTELCGYVGLLTLLLGIIALLKPKRHPLVWFWAGFALFTLLLTFGVYLPFGLHKLLYRVPVYNLFRVSARNLLLVTFSLSILSGLGISALAQSVGREALRLWLRGVIVMTVIVLGTLVTYRYFWNHLVAMPPPVVPHLLTNAEALLPLGFFVLSAATLWFYARRPSLPVGLVLVLILIVDLASFGHYVEWRIFNLRVADQMTDPPTVKYIKDRESDYASFRVLSYAPWPYDHNYDLLNHPDISIIRGLQSINGYDMMQLKRLASIAGNMGSEGIVWDISAFDLPDQGFNLLNVKYLLREKSGVMGPATSVVHEGIRFKSAPIGIWLKPGMRIEMPANGNSADELALVTTMSESASIPDNSVVAKAILYAKNGSVIEREILAGRDTAEWAHEYPEVRAVVKHQRARVIESWPGGGANANHYLARIPFDRAEIDRVAFEYLRENAQILLSRASLYDSTTGVSTSLDNTKLSPERWRKLESFGEVELYQNLKAMPRAWFVRRAIVEFSSEVLQSIKTGKLKDGSAFDPAETVLFEREDFGNRETSLPEIGDPTGAEVKVTRYEPNRIELRTRNSQPGFLVLSEMYYRGWEAWVDGKRVPVEKVNYAFRGIAVPPGEHRVEFVFRAHSFRNGASYSALGALMLFVGGVISKRRRRASLSAGKN